MAEQGDLAAYGRVPEFGGTDPMATIEILSGDFEREITRIRYSDAGRAFLRLRSVDGHVEDLFLENEVVASAEAGEGATGRGHERDRHLFVVLLRGGRKIVVRGDREAMLQFECAAMPADLRRARLAEVHAAATRPVPGLVARLREGLFGRLLQPGGR